MGPCQTEHWNGPWEGATSVTLGQAPPGSGRRCPLPEHGGQDKCVPDPQPNWRQVLETSAGQVKQTWQVTEFPAPSLLLFRAPCPCSPSLPGPGEGSPLASVEGLPKEGEGPRASGSRAWGHLPSWSLCLNAFFVPCKDFVHLLSIYYLPSALPHLHSLIYAPRRQRRGGSAMSIFIFIV